MEISIIGGGITGLAASLALNKVGIKSTVYEKAASLNEIGAGIWLQPNALQICHWLGIKEAIENAGSKISKMEITNPDLIPIKKINAEVVMDDFGNQTIAIHRAQLQQILYNECSKVGAVVLDMEYLSHQVKGEKVVLNFSSGTVTSDLVLAADGIHSRVRNQLFPNVGRRDAHQICWRGISHFSLPDHLKGYGKEAWGRKIRFGFSQISDDQVYWFAVASSGVIDEHADKEGLVQLFKEFDPVVSGLIANTIAIHCGPIKDLERLPTWHDGRICLLGDAAHATTPNMGQGACQGIEDAYFISQFLQKGMNHSEAFRSFELSRRKKVDYIVNNSWTFGRLAHNIAGQQLLKLIMKVTPESVMNKQMKKLYAVDIV